MILVLTLGFLVSAATAQINSAVLIGQGTNKLFFATRSTSSWDLFETLDYCQMYSFKSAKITNQRDFDLITEFLRNNTEFPSNTTLWLPATDIKVEGRYQWLEDNSDVAFGTWPPGTPSVNRSLNCLYLNGQGELIEERCMDASKAHNILCETSLYHSGMEEPTAHVPQRKPILESKPSLAKVLKMNPKLEIIGEVGGKVYLLDDLGYFPIALERCHAQGLKLAAPEETEQLDFLKNYALEQAQAGAPNPIYYLAGSDMLSTSCNKSNANFRWYYSNNPVGNGTMTANEYRYRCLLMTPSGLSYTGCMRGGGAEAWGICEL